MIIEVGSVLLHRKAHRFNPGELAGTVAEIHVIPNNIGSFEQLYPNSPKVADTTGEWRSIKKIVFPYGGSFIATVRILVGNGANKGLYYDSYLPLNERFELLVDLRSDWEKDFEMA